MSSEDWVIGVEVVLVELLLLLVLLFSFAEGFVDELLAVVELGGVEEDELANGLWLKARLETELGCEEESGELETMYVPGPGLE